MNQYKIRPTYGNKATATCFIVPAYMLEKQAMEGSKEERKQALYNLRLSQYIRGMRTANAKIRNIAPAAAHQEKRRVIYDMENTEGDLPGKPVRYEGGPETGNNSTDECYKNLGIVYDFYKEEFARNSINGQGMTMVGTVNYGVRFDNAFWEGKQMVYGDGGGGFLKEESLTSLDVTAHELQHGVTQFFTPEGLEYADQSGGLNESWSDCFGIMCKQWGQDPQQEVGDSNWLIGEGIMVQGDALRSMKDPGTANPFDGQIARASEYEDGMDPHVQLWSTE